MAEPEDHSRAYAQATDPGARLLIGRIRESALPAPATSVSIVRANDTSSNSSSHYIPTGPASHAGFPVSAVEDVPLPKMATLGPANAQPPSTTMYYTRFSSPEQIRDQAAPSRSLLDTGDEHLSSMDVGNREVATATQHPDLDMNLEARVGQHNLSTTASSDDVPADGLKRKGQGVAGALMRRPSLIRSNDERRGSSSDGTLNLDRLPNELLMHVLGHLEVCDLLATSRTNHHLRSLSLLPILHHYRLRRARLSLPSLLVSPSRPTLAELIARHIVLTHTTQISRRLARSLVAIRLSRRLPLRPSAESLVQRGVLPGECFEGSVSPGLVAKKRAVERERLKDGLRGWVGGFWKGEVRERGEGVRKWDESRGVGRVWKLRRFWERVSRDGEEGLVP